LSIAAVILCGGRATRMGGIDKPLLTLGGRTLLDRIIGNLRTQAFPIAISANGDPSRLARLGLPVLPDPIGGFPGPLGGILASLEWASELDACDGLVTLAGDTPFFPPDLVARLVDAETGPADRIAMATSGGRGHPVFALWPLSTRASLKDFLTRSNDRSVAAFARTVGIIEVEFPQRFAGGAAFDPFFNINHPHDLDEAERIIRNLEV